MADLEKYIGKVYREGSNGDIIRITGIGDDPAWSGGPLFTYELLHNSFENRLRWVLIPLSNLTQIYQEYDQYDTPLYKVLNEDKE